MQEQETRILGEKEPFVGPYRILQEIGRGGMGIVYKVARSDRTVLALKIILDKESVKPDQNKRFMREIRMLSQIAHPNIIKIHDIGEWGGRAYFVMDCLEGVSLAQHLKKKQKLSEREAIELMAPITRALDSIHQCGIIHRDIKPENIMLANEKPYLMDFGIAFSMYENTRVTRTGVSVGTPNYMPPEQARGQWRKMGPWTDTYQLGTTLYHLITGVVPFHGRTALDVMLNLSTQDLRPVREYNAQASKDIEQLIQKATQKDIPKRYQTAEEMAEEMEAILAGEGRAREEKRSSSVKKRRKSAVARRKYRRNSSRAGVYASLLGIFVIGFLFSLYIRTSWPPPDEEGPSGPVVQKPSPGEKPPDVPDRHIPDRDPAQDVPPREKPLKERIERLRAAFDEALSKRERSAQTIGLALAQLYREGKNAQEELNTFAALPIQNEEVLEKRMQAGIAWVAECQENQRWSEGLRAWEEIPHRSDELLEKKQAFYLSLAEVHRKKGAFPQELTTLQWAPLKTQAVLQRRMELAKMFQLPLEEYYCLNRLAMSAPNDEGLKRRKEMAGKEAQEVPENLAPLRTHVRKILKSLGYCYISNWDMKDPHVLEELENAGRLCLNHLPDLSPFVFSLRTMFFLKKEGVPAAHQEISKIQKPQRFLYPVLTQWHRKVFWVEHYFATGMLYLKNNQRAQALEMFKTIRTYGKHYPATTADYLFLDAEFYLERTPNHPDGWTQKIDVHLHHFVNALVMRGIINNEYVALQNIPEAVANYEDLLAVNIIPDKHMLHYKLGYRLLSGRQFVAAEKHLEMAKLLSPGFNEVVYLLGEVYFHTRRFRQAKECFEYCVEHPPQWDKNMLEKSRQYLKHLEKYSH